MSHITIVRPAYYRVIQRIDNIWRFREGQPFYNPTHMLSDYHQVDIYQSYSTTMKKVAIALFRINGGKAGFYIANLRDREYYYCGESLSDVKLTLQNLGIGRPDLG
jgi:hypothetical protein